MTAHTATYTPNQNFSLVDPTTYKTGLDSNAIVAQRDGDKFAVHQQATAAMSVVVEPGHIFDGVTLTEIGSICNITTTSGSTAATIDVAAGIANGMVVRSANTVANDAITISGLNVTLATNATASGTVTAVFMQKSASFTAPLGNPRIDRVVANRLTGVISVITGTPAATPVAPAITTGNVPLAQVLLQTSTTSITNPMIIDERDGAAFGRGLAGELGLGAWTKNDGSNNLTLKVNASLKDDGSGNLTTAFFTEAPLASGATVDLGTVSSNIIRITGNTNITSFGNSASTASPIYLLRFTGTPTLTNSGTLITGTGANLPLTAGSCVWVKFEGSSTWRVIDYLIPAVVTAGAYTAANLTVTADGRITAVSNGTAAGQLINVTYITSSQTWTKQAGTNSIEVELWGAGGGTTGDGGTSIFDVMTATGGQRAVTGSLGGTATGGDLNISGGNGPSSNPSANGAVGGASPRGGQGSVVGSSNGGAPGGGGSIASTGYSASGGAYSYKYYKNTAPSSISVTIGAGGTGTSAGGAGACLIKEYT